MNRKVKVKIRSARGNSWELVLVFGRACVVDALLGEVGYRCGVARLKVTRDDAGSEELKLRKGKAER
jgi:hypothetical protein